MILAAILLPYIINRVEESRISRMVGEIRSLKTAVLLYYNDLSVFPNTWDDFVSNGPTNPQWKGPYIEKIPNSTTATWTEASPWKTNFRLIVEYDNQGFNFAGQTNYNFTKGIALEVVNPHTAGINVIPRTSLEKIDRELDDGSPTTGLIVGGQPNANSLSTITITTQGYSENNVSLYVLLQGLR
ncbi:MAG: type II secretion system protein GspG [Candidatus Calescibacterium sp.]|nr:type II secretion system protein GspG [Candidatus Calescibacterium sp.]